jgi:hypothetical protein
VQITNQRTNKQERKDFREGQDLSARGTQHKIHKQPNFYFHSEPPIHAKWQQPKNNGYFQQLRLPRVKADKANINKFQSWKKQKS